MTAKVDGMDVAIGNNKLMKSPGIDAMECHQVGTGCAYGSQWGLCRSYPDRRCGERTFWQSHSGTEKAGIRKTVMLTGDADPVWQNRWLLS